MMYLHMKSRRVRIKNLRSGALFLLHTENGSDIYCFKSEYSREVRNILGKVIGTQCNCFLLESGEYLTIPNQDETLVFELERSF